MNNESEQPENVRWEPQKSCEICGNDPPCPEAKPLRNKILKQSVSHGLTGHLVARNRLGAFESSDAFLKEVEKRTLRWNLCEKCRQDVEAWRFGPSIEFRQAQLNASRNPITDPLIITHEQREFRVLPWSVASVAGLILKRLLVLVLLFLALDLAFEHIPKAFATQLIFDYVPSTIPMLDTINRIPGMSTLTASPTKFLSLRSKGKSMRPTHAAIGFSALGLALFAFNALFSKPRGRGPIDWLFWRWGRNAVEAFLLPLTPPRRLIIIWALALFVLLGLSYRYHFTAKAGIAAIGMHDLQGILHDSNGLLFARGKDHVSHIMRITPDLVRELERANIDVTQARTDPSELPVPGFLPFLLLLVTALWQFANKEAIYRNFKTELAKDWQDLLWRETRLAQRNLVTAFGLVNLYVVIWLVSGESGIYTSHGTIHPLWLANMTFLLFCSLGMLYATVRTVEDPRYPLAVRAGWGGIFFGLNIVTLVLIMTQSGSSLGNPAYCWINLWMLTAAVCWHVSVPWEALKAQ